MPITFADKNEALPTSDPRRMVRDVDVNEIKNVLNALEAAFNALLSGAPGALDTLNELAAAINDDANYAAAVTTALGLRPLATSFKYNIIPTGVVNGSNSVFVLPDTPVAGTLCVYVDLGRLIKDVDFTLVGATITTVVPPVSGIVTDYRT